MVDTARTLAALQTIFADGQTAGISAQDVRDLLYSAHPSGKTAAKVVAAADAPLLHQVKADYICDGTNDHTDINNAIAAVISEYGGGVVRLVGQNFNISGAINMDSGVTLEGHGWDCVLTITTTNLTGISLNGKSNVILRDFTINATANDAEDFCIRILNSSDVVVDHVKITDTTGFGLFIDAAPHNTTERIHVDNCHFEGNATNDVLGGGPQDSAADTLCQDVWVRNCYIITDKSGGGTYLQALAVTKMKRWHIEGCTFKGSVQTAPEQGPSEQVWFVNNTVMRAVGATSSELAILGVTPVTGMTSPHRDIHIEGNTLDLACIVVEGISGQKVDGVTIRDNKIRTSNLQNGIYALYCTNGTINDNKIYDVTAGIYMENSDNITVSGNKIKTAAYGIRDITGVDTITGSENNLQGITTSYIVGGSGWTRNSPAQRVGFYDMGTVSGAVAVDVANGDHLGMVLGGNVTDLSINNPLVQGNDTLWLTIKQSAGGSNTVTWNANVWFAAGANPTITATANATDIFMFTYDYVNARWVGFLVQNVS